MLLAPAAGSAQLVGFAGSGVALGGNPGALLVLRYPCFIFFLLVLPYRFSCRCILPSEAGLSSGAAEHSCPLPALAPSVLRRAVTAAGSRRACEEAELERAERARRCGYRARLRGGTRGPRCRASAALGSPPLSAGGKGRMEDVL